MLVMSLRLRPTQERDRAYLPGLAPGPRLRVDYTVRSQAWFDRYVPKDKSIIEHSIIYELISTLEFDQAVSAVEDWSSLNLGVVRAEAIRLPTDAIQAKVLAFVVPA